MDLKTCYETLQGDYEAVMGRLRQEERVVRFLRLFPQDENFQLLGQAITAQDWPTAFRAAHSLKGVALNLGLTRLARSTSELTELLRPGTPQSDPTPLYTEVKADYEIAVGAIAALTDEV